MSRNDKIKLAVAVAVLLGAAILIYLNLRTPGPTNPGGAAATTTSAPAAPDAPPPPRGPTRGRYQGK